MHNEKIINLAIILIIVYTETGISDQESVRDDSTGVQDAADQAITADSATLRHIQDRLGLADPAVYILRGHHGAVQRRICHNGRVKRAGVHR